MTVQTALDSTKSKKAITVCFKDGKLNKKLLRAFKKSKMSNYRLSEESGVSQSTIGRWVRSELPRGLGLETAEKIAEALGLKFDLVECD